jgi:hypothetical protein
MSAQCRDAILRHCVRHPRLVSMPVSGRRLHNAPAPGTREYAVCYTVTPFAVETLRVLQSLIHDRSSTLLKP